MRRGVVVLLLLTACTTEPPAPVPTPAASPSPEPAGTGLREPYPFTTPTPPPEPTTVDGDYVRIVGPDLAGAPGKCRRCPPYRIEVAASTLRLRDGVFLIENEIISPKAIDWKSIGHYVVEGDRLTLFNDPNCPTSRGRYRWSIEEHVLSLEVIEDECAFGGLRWRYLMRAPWAATSSEGSA